MAYTISVGNGDSASITQNSTSNGAWLDLVGNTSGANTLRVFSGANQRWEFRNGGAGTGTWDLYNVTTGGDGASVLVSTGPGHLQIPGLGSPSGASVDLVVDTDGNVYKQSSSLRYKDNVKPLAEDFAKIMALRPISFTAKGGGAEQIGYAAEEVAEAGLDHLVTRDGEGRPEAVSYKHVGIYAVEMLKRQGEVIERQGAELDRLRETLQALEAKLAN